LAAHPFRWNTPVPNANLQAAIKTMFALNGKEETDLVMTVDGLAANTVRIGIR
jgi:hypothetical protein